MKTIKETKEVIAAVAVIAVHLRADLADGKLSIFEIIGLAKDVPALKDALNGIADVPGEVLDLTDEEAGLLAIDVSDLLTSLGLSHHIADVSNELIHAAAALTRSVVNILRLPPAPQIVK